MSDNGFKPTTEAYESRIRTLESQLTHARAANRELVESLAIMTAQAEDLQADLVRERAQREEAEAELEGAEEAAERQRERAKAAEMYLAAERAAREKAEAERDAALKCAEEAERRLCQECHCPLSQHVDHPRGYEGCAFAANDLAAARSRDDGKTAPAPRKDGER